jgi:exodeoxyribonuclease V alpha subunit
VSRLAALTGAPAESISPPVARISSRLNDCVIWFTKNYRFASDSGIGRLAAHINAGESKTGIEWLRTATDPSVRWIEDGNRIPAEETMACATSGYTEYLQATKENIEDKNAVFKAFERFRILCAMREGPRGVDDINKQVSRHFRQSMNHVQIAGEQSDWYPGRPVIILRNDHVLKLFNGDIGISLPDTSNDENQMMVYFPDSDGGFRAISPLRLPEHETAFAMTAHKSQGSEFDSILLLLPSTHNRVVSRELLYTAITRSRKQVTIASNETVLRQAIESPANRRSGLIRRLQEADGLR